MRKMKKALALALSASMMMGMSLTSFAADQEVEVDAPIYAYDVTNVIVPTNFLVAFNPNGLDVDKDGGTTIVQDQIVSKNYGIINKSTKDKVITVTLKVEDLNEGKITFASDPADVTNAAADDYVINLTAVPADATEVKVGSAPATADLTTTGADLADATMTPATGKGKVLLEGENDVDFLLTKADYQGKIDLSAATGNNVADDFTISGLAAAGKGITAFTFGGTMNAKADWTKLTKGIRITAVYSNDNAPDGAAAESGTGALFENPNPVFKAGSEVGTIKYRAGTGNDAVASITSVEMDYKGTIYDGYNALSGAWAAANDVNGIITLPSEYIENFVAIYPDDATREATITYVTTGGDTKTATVNVRLKKLEIVDKASFVAGSVAGTINYTTGSGNDAVASITSIEMDYNGTYYDGYNALSGTWEAATDENGTITFPSQFMQNYLTAYPGDTSREAIVTYVTVGGETKTATVDVKLK